MFFLLFSFIGGYATGWLSHKTIAQLRAPMGICNIGKNGIVFRSWIALILIVTAFFLELPLVAFFGGFAWYESRAKWCIVRTIKK